MINTQNIQVNKSKKFSIQINENSIGVLTTILTEITPKILEQKGVEGVELEQDVLTITGKALSTNLSDIIQLLKNNGIQTALIEETFPVLGMTCASCSNSVETILRKTDGVVSADVNLIENSVYIKFFPKLTNENQLQEKLDMIGYQMILPEKKK